MRVSDDGADIPTDEVELAFARHATSKLKTAEDLSHVQTLGFRGEALASVASVSRVSLVTRAADEDETLLAAEVEARLIARVCKRAAVKAGQVLTPAEQMELVRQLERCVSPRTCPHGRPTMIHLSVDAVEKQFGRKG